jgi:hypothetical protein
MGRMDRIDRVDRMRTMYRMKIRYIVHLYLQLKTMRVEIYYVDIGK